MAKSYFFESANLSNGLDLASSLYQEIKSCPPKVGSLSIFVSSVAATLSIETFGFPFPES